MATKKQKREKALAKRAAFLEEHRQHGLEALKRDREEREHQEERMKETARQIDRRYMNILAAHLIKSKSYK